MKITIGFEKPLLPGSISKAKSRCGKLGCACKSKNPKLHGIYYRWTGILEGKRTTKTISKEVAAECEIRIDRYKKFKKQVELLLTQSLREAPWNPGFKNRVP